MPTGDAAAARPAETPFKRLRWNYVFGWLFLVVLAWAGNLLSPVFGDLGGLLDRVVPSAPPGLRIVAFAVALVIIPLVAGVGANILLRFFQGRRNVQAVLRLTGEAVLHGGAGCDACLPGGRCSTGPTPTSRRWGWSPALSRPRAGRNWRPCTCRGRRIRARAPSRSVSPRQYHDYRLDGERHPGFPLHVRFASVRRPVERGSASLPSLRPSKTPCSRGFEGPRTAGIKQIAEGRFSGRMRSPPVHIAAIGEDCDCTRHLRRP